LNVNFFGFNLVNYLVSFLSITIPIGSLVVYILARSTLQKEFKNMTSKKNCKIEFAKQSAKQKSKQLQSGHITILMVDHKTNFNTNH